MSGGRRPELVVTLGPKSFELARELRQAGATRFRLNLSHMSPSEAKARVERLLELDPAFPLTLDLQGNKIRLGDFAARELAAGEELRFVLGQRSTTDQIPIPHPELFAAVRPGEELGCHDDQVTFLLLETGPTELRARCVRPGRLEPRKGCNRRLHPLDPEALSPSDRRFLELMPRTPALGYAFSFVRDGSEKSWVQAVIPGVTLVLKLERAEALSRVRSLAELGSELWLCRGDLGAQLGLHEMARAVAELRPSELPVPVLMAGQVLEHLTQHSTPTRSEICHVHDILTRGYAGIVLSDETAIGLDPLGATEWARRLLAG